MLNTAKKTNTAALIIDGSGSPGFYTAVLVTGDSATIHRETYPTDVRMGLTERHAIDVELKSEIANYLLPPPKLVTGAFIRPSRIRPGLPDCRTVLQGWVDPPERTIGSAPGHFAGQ